jgi:V/A-type H+-transporting ATPase subunit I
MTFRPRPTRWFELLTVGIDAPLALEALAETGAVELEVESGATRRSLLPDTAGLLEEFRRLARTHGTHWPKAAPLAHRPDHPRRLLEAAWARLVAWRKEADPIIRAIEATVREAEDLEMLRAALFDIGDDCPDPAELADVGPRLAARLYRLPPGIRLPDPPGRTLVETWDGLSAAHVLVLGPRREVAEIDALVPALEGRVVPLPDWLPVTPAGARAAVEARIERLTIERHTAETRLAALSGRHALAEALGDFALIDWLARNAADVAGSERLAWVTGWTTDEDGDALRAALDRRGVRGLLRILPDPPGAEAPLVLRNPAWVRPFEVFASLLGTPDRAEADASPLLAVVAPLMFGFMFGDVGQGLVLIGAGLVLRRRLPVLALLVPGGVAAVVFGFLFGSVFCLEDLLPALWIHPLGAPTTLLATALLGGIVLLLVGLALDGFQAHWRGELGHWAMHRAGLVFAYVAILTAVVWPPAAWAALLGVVWFVAGAAAIDTRDRRIAAGVALAEFAEAMVQLLVNTVSFARVGAFALAHAGLAAAIVGVAEVSGPVGFWIVLILGNALVLALEGLVVGIQTTRLILFEFFIRFLHGGGRPFRPLVPPHLDWAPAAPRD